MAIISKLTLRYQRRQGFPGYSHVELETIKEFLIEQGDNPITIEDQAWLDMAASIAKRIEPIAASYRQAALERNPQTTSAGPQPTYHRPQATTPEPEQAELELANMPATRPEGRPMPQYDKKGTRKRTVDQKSFTVAEINSAWQALADVGIVSGEITSGKGHNEDRGHMRSWLLASPLDPGFSQTELQFTAEQYRRYRDQGNTTLECMKEVGNDFQFTFGADAPAKGADTPSPGHGDQAASGLQVQAGEHDQEPGESPGDTEPDNGELAADGGTADLAESF